MRRADILRYSRAAATRANGAGWLALPDVRELLVVHAQHIDVDVDPVE
jgi:hypothetical protein